MAPAVKHAEKPVSKVKSRSAGERQRRAFLPSRLR